jgi:serine protease Do
LRNTVAALRPGENANFEILRDGKTQKLKINIALRDENNLAGANPKSKESKKETDSSKNDWGIQAVELTKAQKKEAGLPESSGGVLVVSVSEKSLAEKAGIRKGDIILAANNKFMASLKDFNTVFGENSKTMLLLVRRGGGQFYTVLEK